MPEPRHRHLRGLLVVLTKEPRLGTSKTRLAADIGAEKALRFAEAFVLDTLALACAGSSPVLVAYAPEDAGPWFAERAPFASTWPQPAGNLGVRMREAFREAFQRGFERCVIIGMDTPQLSPDRLDEAFHALDRADICIGPAEDGGYYLIGARVDEPALFRDIPWSTPSVLQTTLERCETAGRSVVQLDTEFDVDDARSLDALGAVLAERPGAAPRTRQLLSS